MTIRCTSDSLNSRPNNASEAATVAALLPCSLKSLSSITPPSPARVQAWQPARVSLWPPAQMPPWPPQVWLSTELLWATDPDPRRFGSRPHDHGAAATPRNGTLYQEQLTLGVDPHDLKGLNGAFRGAHLAGQTL